MSARVTTVPAHKSRRGRLARTLAVGVLSTALVAAAPGTAEAGTVSNPDAAGDMTEIDYGGGPSTPAPDRIREDVLNTTLTHGTRRVSIRVEYADLDFAEGGTELYVEMVTNEGVRRNLDVTAFDSSVGEAQMYRGERPIRCAIRHSIDYTTNVIRVSFPRACAGFPRWVKFSVASVAWDDGDGIFLDDALLDRAVTDDDTHMVRSRRVYRARLA